MGDAIGSDDSKHLFITSRETHSDQDACVCVRTRAIFRWQSLEENAGQVAADNSLKYS